MFIAIYLLAIIVNTNSELQIKQHTDHSSLTFNEKGKMLEIIKYIEINVIVDIQELADRGKELIKAVTRSTETLSCINSTTGNCKSATQEIEKHVIHVTHELALMMSKKQHTERRRRRGLRFLGEILHDIADVTTEEERRNIIDDLTKIKTTQDEIIDQTTKGKELFAEAFKQFKKESNELKTITTTLSKEVTTTTNRINKQMEDQQILASLRRATDILATKVLALTELTATGKITGKLIELTELQRLFNSTTNTLEEDETIPYDNAWQIVTSEQAKTSIRKFLFRATIQVPICATRPWSIFNIRKHPTIENNILTIVEPKFNYIAIDNEKQSTLMAENDCKTTPSNLTICQLSEKISTQEEASCTARAMMMRTDTFKSCEDLEIHRLELKKDFIFRISSDLVLIYTQHPKTITASCERGATHKITTTTEISSVTPCKIKLGTATISLVPTKKTTKKLHLKSPPLKIEEERRNPIPTHPHTDETNIEHVDTLSKKIQDYKNQAISRGHLDLREDHDRSTLYGGTSIITLAVLVTIIILCCCLIRR